MSDNITFGKYILKLTLILSIPYILGLIILLFILPQYYFSLYPFIILLFIVMGIPFYGIWKKRFEDNRKFLTRFMSNIFVKLFLSLFVILLYVVCVKEQIISFLIVFFIFYMALSVFEIKTFMGAIKTSGDVQ